VRVLGGGLPLSIPSPCPHFGICTMDPDGAVRRYLCTGTGAQTTGDATPSAGCAVHVLFFLGFFLVSKKVFSHKTNIFKHNSKFMKLNIVCCNTFHLNVMPQYIRLSPPSPRKCASSPSRIRRRSRLCSAGTGSPRGQLTATARWYRLSRYAAPPW